MKSFIFQRKRYSKDIQCMLFPDVKVGVRKVGRGPSITDSSATKSWESCGDSFLDTPVIKVGNVHRLYDLEAV